LEAIENSQKRLTIGLEDMEKLQRKKQGCRVYRKVTFVVDDPIQMMGFPEQEDIEEVERFEGLV